MAIPFHLPTDEETEDIYRRIDQIIFDLYEILRQLLRRQTAQVADLRVRALADEVINPAVPPPADETASVNRAPLPDLVLPTAQALPALGSSIKKAAPVPPPRRRRRRHHSDKTVNNYHHTTAMASVVSQQQPKEPLLRQTIPCRSWLNVGFELRQIAEELTVKSQCEGAVEKKERHEIKASSLFSLLVPAPITGSIWTTVIILVGWRILVARQR